MTGQMQVHVHAPGCCPGRHPGVPVGVACPGRAPVWCSACGAAVVDAVRGLPVDVARLPAHGRLRMPMGERARGRPGVTVSSPSPAADLVDEVVRWASLLAERLRAHVDDPPHTWRPGQQWMPPALERLTAATSYLVHRRSALLAWDTRTTAPEGELDGMAEAEVVGRQAFAWRSRLARAAGLDRLVHRLAMPCPRCDTRALVRADGDERVQCRTCRAEWTEERYQLLARIYAGLAAEEEGVTP